MYAKKTGPLMKRREYIRLPSLFVVLRKENLMSKLESGFQAKLIKELKIIFEDCIVTYKVYRICWFCTKTNGQPWNVRELREQKDSLTKIIMSVR